MDEEEGLGMKMPPREMTIGEIAQAVGASSFAAVVRDGADPVAQVPRRLSRLSVRGLLEKREPARKLTLARRRRLPILAFALDSRAMGGLLHRSASRQGPQRHLARSEREQPRSARCCA